MTPDHKALCDRLLAFNGDGYTRFNGKTMCENAAEAIATLSAREAALIDTIARLTAERDA